MIKTSRLMFSFLTIPLLQHLLLTCKNSPFAGANSFEDLALKCSVYVDKTSFIKDFIQTNFTLTNANETAFANSTVHVLRLAYPRKWGKTTNLKMLEDFLKMEVDSEGNPKNQTETAAYRLFVLGKWSTGDHAELNIAKDKDFLQQQHLANHPVIYVTFAGVTGTKYDEIVLGVKQAVAEAFKTHSYMLKVYERQIQNTSSARAAKNQAQLDSAQFQAYLSSTASEASMLVAVKFLTEQLYKHFDRKVYVFVDDHDQPLRSVFAAGVSEPKLVAAVSLFLTRVILCSFYHLCYYYRPNLAVEKAVITGVIRVVSFSEDAKFLDGMDYNRELSLLDKQFDRYFGFNEEEVDVVFAMSNIDKKQAVKAKKWYRGYSVLDIPKEAVSKSLFQRFCSKWKICSVDLYNPYDIERFASKGVVSSYWAQSGSVPFLADFLRNKMVESLIISLLNGEKLEVELFELGITSEELQQLTRLLDPAISTLPRSKFSGHETDLLYAFLLAEGYLTPDEDTPDYMKRVRLPNEEIVLDMSTKLLQHYSRVYSIPLDVQNRVVEGLKHLNEGNNTVTFKESLETLFSKFTKFTDRKSTSAQDVINAALNTVILTARQVYEADSTIYLWNNKGSELKSSAARPSVMLTLEKQQLGVVMQLMYSASEKELARIQNYAKCFGKNKNVQNIRLLTINVRADKSVVINEVWKPNRRFF